MTLPDDDVLELLRDRFVVGWQSIEREKFVGVSRGYSKRQSAVGTTNGAGAHNVQIFVLAPDHTVLHALPGFWHPDDLIEELQFALVVDRLWRDPTRTREEKAAMFARLHATELRGESAATEARSSWQRFDSNAELRRARQAERDTVVLAEDGKPESVKPLNVVMRERMAARPFVPLEAFDVEEFVDYGITHYDNNRRFDHDGRRFAFAEKVEQHRQKVAAKQAKQRRLREEREQHRRR